MLCHLQNLQMSSKIPKDTARSSSSWESLSHFARSFHVETNKENIMCDTQKHPPGAIHFSAGKNVEKDTKSEFTFLSSMHRQIFGCGKTPSPRSVLAFARTKPDFGAWAGERQELGQNSSLQAELRESVCSGKVPFYFYELAAVFRCAGPSPGESPSEEMCPNFVGNCHVTSLSKFALGTWARRKMQPPTKMVRRNSPA